MRYLIISAATVLMLLSACTNRPAATAGASHGDYSPAISARTCLHTTTNAAGQAIVFPTPAEVTVLDVVIPVGAETGWHRHPGPGFAYVISGQVLVETADGLRRTYGPGQAFAEVIDLPHNGRAVGNEPVHLVAFFTVVTGTAVTTKEPAPAR